jgi:glyoxylate utilization-related uncharacterized protein
MMEQENLSPAQLKQLRATWFVMKESYEKVSGKMIPGELLVQKTPTENELLSPNFLQDLHQTAMDIRKIAFDFNLEEKSQ